MFARVRGWLRRHATLVDALGVAPFLLLCTIGIVNSAGMEGRPAGLPVPVHVAVTLALLLPLVLRRRFPSTVFAVVAAVALLQLVLVPGLILAHLAVIVAMYTVAAHCRLTWALAALGTVEFGLGLTIVRFPYADWGDWKVFPSYTFFILLCWVTGLYAKVRRGYLLGLEERAEWLERERDARAQAAIAEERARIAREMHDVVAHNLSVMVVQADGATYTVESDPRRAKGALETVAETGRSALAEIRGILGVLREGAHEQEYAPRPGIEQLGRLLEQVRSAGLPVKLAVEGRERSLPAGIGLAAYRVVQEALTNTLKHAGASSRARVWLCYGEDTLEIRVVDSGPGAATPTTTEPEQGQGLIGMRERVSVYGGSVRAGARTGGGYEVVASLPLQRVAAQAESAGGGHL